MVAASSSASIVATLMPAQCNNCRIMAMTQQLCLHFLLHLKGRYASVWLNTKLLELQLLDAGRGCHLLLIKY
jgi:hypothetical protein